MFLFLLSSFLLCCVAVVVLPCDVFVALCSVKVALFYLLCLPCDVLLPLHFVSLCFTMCRLGLRLCAWLCVGFGCGVFALRRSMCFVASVLCLIALLRVALIGLMVVLLRVAVFCVVFL